jgi:hypothetical protein
MMACKTEKGEDLVLTELRLNWKGQCGLHLYLTPGIDGVVMAVAHVDELIGELIQARDAMERENERRNK